MDPRVSHYPSNAARRGMVSDHRDSLRRECLLQIFDAKIRFHLWPGHNTGRWDAAAHGMERGTMVVIVVDGLFIVMLILCSRWAKTGSQGAFLGGMIAYAARWRVAPAFQHVAGRGRARLRTLDDLAGYAAARELAQLQQAAQPGLVAAKAP